MALCTGREYGHNGIAMDGDSTAHLGDVIVNNTVILESARAQKGLERWKVKFDGVKPFPGRGPSNIIDDRDKDFERNTTSPSSDEALKRSQRYPAGDLGLTVYHSRFRSRKRKIRTDTESDEDVHQAGKAIINRKSVKYSNHIDDRALRNPGVYPESYCQTSIAGACILELALVPAEDRTWIRSLVDYAHTTRKRERLVIDVAVNAASQKFPKGQMMLVDNATRDISMPSSFVSVLRSILNHCFMQKHGTHLTLRLAGRFSENPRVMAYQTEPCKEFSRSAFDQEQELIAHARENNYPVFLESQVAVEKNGDYHQYRVWVKSMSCWHILFPTIPATAETPAKLHQLHEYCKTVKFVAQMRDTIHFAQFHGIVMDASRERLLGYLVERPTINSMWWLLLSFKVRGMHIPTSIKESWCWQVIRGLLEIHQKGLVLGPFNLLNISVRADGSILLRRNFASRLKAFDDPGGVPPELKLRRHREESARGYTERSEAVEHWTPAMDVYALGMLLWSLMDGAPPVNARFCVLEACTSFPKHSCENAHVEPIQMPPLLGLTDTFVEQIITQCRAKDPQVRPSTEELWALVEKRCIEPEKLEQEISGILKISEALNMDDNSQYVICDECGPIPPHQTRYHCTICSYNNFDLCEECVASGVHCKNPNHLLEKVVDECEELAM